MESNLQFHTYTRSGDDRLEEPYEKPVIVPGQADQRPASHAWADARFATDIMSEHAQFFALLMPPELAPTERQQAVDFSAQFARMHQRIDAAGPPEASDVPALCAEVIEAMKPFGEVGGWLGVWLSPLASSAGPEVSRSSGQGSLGSANRPLSIRT